jgi:pseudouridine synthase
MINKPAGYVCSRQGQGSRTIYELLPSQYHGLKPVGRLDKASSGLLLLTNDGDLANRLTHPRYVKDKVYEIALSQPLTPAHQGRIDGEGVVLEDGRSRLALARLERSQDRCYWRVTMQEGRNRQIRRTFAALGYQITALHRTHFGPYSLNKLEAGRYITVDS